MVNRVSLGLGMAEMNTVFGEAYSKYYDILYGDKDYDKECDFIEETFSEYSRVRPVKVLDLGCGTGGHLVRLARRGYKLVGIDRSASMVKIASENIRELGLDSEVHVADILDFSFDAKFDACICMFAVINYIVEADDLAKTLANIRRHLRRDAVSIFDLWYGPAVLSVKPSARVKVVEKGGVKVIRAVVPELDTFKHTQRSNYYLFAIKDGMLIDEVHEIHTLRYFFPQELTHYLGEAGFEVLRFCEFPYLNRSPSENTWNVAVVARAV